MTYSLEKHTEELRVAIHEHLRVHPRISVSGQGQKEAAVVLVLVPDDEGGSAVLLTRRAGHLRRHGGQWALPGGRLEKGEDFETAALRELREELGIDLAPEQVLGRLDDYQSRSGYRIVPVVAWCRTSIQPDPDPNEVAAVYHLPVVDLHDAVPADGRPRGPVPSLALLGTRIFAPTAALLFQFVEVALRNRPTRVDDFGEPFFAWR